MNEFARGRRTITVVSSVLASLLMIMLAASPANAQLIRSWPSDPWMTADQERDILRALSQPWTPPAETMTIADIAVELRTRCVTRIDQGSLESFGLTDQEKITFGTLDSRPMIAHILTGLQDENLIVNLDGGALHLCTEESADDNLPVRIYDLQPLVDRDPRISTTSLSAQQRGQVMALEEIMNIIQATIEPDSWEALGGVGVMRADASLGRTRLVISATSPIHWKIDTLLQRMAGNGETPSITDSVQGQRPATITARPGTMQPQTGRTETGRTETGRTETGRMQTGQTQNTPRRSTSGLIRFGGP